MFHVTEFLQTLPVMGKGMLGIFCVAGAIILTMYALNFFTKDNGEQ